MNRWELMPAVPFATMMIVGMFVGYYAVPFPVYISLSLIPVCMAAEIFVYNSRKFRSLPMLAAFFLMGFILMSIAKKRLDIVLPADGETIEATVCEVQPNTAKSKVALLVVNNGVLRGQKLRSYVPKTALLEWQLGASYKINGKYQKFNNFDTLSNFNYQRWAESHNLAFQAFVRDWSIEEIDSKLEELPAFERVAVKMKINRERLLERLKKEDIAPEAFSLMSAVAFGERSYIQPKVRDMFAATGVAHLLALSGMHLGILFFVLSLLFLKHQNSILGASVLITTMWCYVFLVGMPPSVMRAALMLTVYQVMAVGYRKKMSVNVLFFVAAVMLVFNPMLIWNVGFQMSCLSMLSIFVFFPHFNALIPQKVHFRFPVLSKIWSVTALSLSAQIGTAPLTIYCFGRFSLLFLLSNIVAIPLITLFLYGVILLVVSLYIPVLKMVTVWMVNNSAALLTAIIAEMSTWTWGIKENISINHAELILMYAAIIALTIMVSVGRKMLRRYLLRR